MPISHIDGGEHIRHYALVDPSIPQVSVALWRADAIVLFDWLRSTDLNGVPADHPAVKQALTDLMMALEVHTDIEYGESGHGLTQEEIDHARHEVTKDIGW